MSFFTFLFLVVLLLLVFGFLGKFLDTVRKGSAKADEGYGEDDTKLLQELSRIAAKLDARVEALETILLDRTASAHTEEERSRHE